MPAIEILDKPTFDNLSDDSLHGRAIKLLDILLAFPVYDQPRWVVRIVQAGADPWPSHTAMLSIRRMFDAMYQVADQLGLRAGRRYVSTAVCACAQNVCSGTLPDTRLEDEDERIAAALSRLVFINARKRRTLGADRSGSATPTLDTVDFDGGPPVDRSEILKDKLLKRDDYTCFMTGYVDVSIAGRLRPEQCTIVYLQVAPIFVGIDRRSHVTTEPNDQVATTTLDILKNYCEIDDDVVSSMTDMYDPQNCLLLEYNSRVNFYCWRWCLIPTDIPNEYHISVYPGLNGAPQVPINDHVTFVDNSPKYAPVHAANSSSLLHERNDGQGGVKLPNATVLRTHAALAGILNLSGAVTLFDMFLYSIDFYGPEPAVPAGDGAGFMKSVIEYDGEEVCVEVESSNSIAELSRPQS